MAVPDFALPRLTILGPIAPATYAVPSGTSVTDGSGLETQLAGSPTNNTIILEDGTYNPSSNYFNNTQGYSVYAENLGGATLTGGLAINTNGDLTVRGLDFDISDTANEANGVSGCIAVGTGCTNVTLLDMTFEGNATVDSAITAREPDGLVIRRIVANNFTDFGILQQRVQGASVRNATPSIISDLEARTIRRATQGSASGTAEFGLWIGHTADCQRIFASGCGWSGIIAGNAAHGCYFSDLISLNNFTGGMYFERFCHGCYIRKFYFDNSPNGINVEYSSVLNSTSTGTLMEYGYIGATKKGVIRDQYTPGFTVRNTWYAGMRHYADNNFGGDFAVDPWDRSGNDYSQIGPNAVETTTAHDSTFKG